MSSRSLKTPKTAEQTEMQFAFRTQEPCIRWGSRSPMGRGNF